jgi:hypothetical protein
MRDKNLCLLPTTPSLLLLLVSSHLVAHPVGLTAALGTRLHLFSVEELIPYDLAHWQQVRSQLSSRQEARCKQLCFRKDPLAYLALLEDRLAKMSLRS